MISVRTRRVQYWSVLGSATIAIAAWVSYSGDGRTATAGSDGDTAVRWTRKQILMLDDLYKTAVVLITKHYVNEPTDLPAGSAAKALFGAMKAKGWHEVRLLDATGDPIMKDNVAKDEFEKAAVADLLRGSRIIDKVVEKDGKRFLRAATPVPVVMKKCVMCHKAYEGKSDKDVIGALAYTVPIEE